MLERERAGTLIKEWLQAFPKKDPLRQSLLTGKGYKNEALASNIPQKRTFSERMKVSMYIH